MPSYIKIYVKPYEYTFMQIRGVVTIQKCLLYVYVYIYKGQSS